MTLSNEMAEHIALPLINIVFLLCIVVFLILDRMEN